MSGIDGGDASLRRSGGQPADAGDAGGADEQFLLDLVDALVAAKAGEPVRMSNRYHGTAGEAARAFNELVEVNSRFSHELSRVAQVAGRDGRLDARVHLSEANGTWGTAVESVNSLIDDLVRPTNEVARVISAVAQGDLTQKMPETIDERPVTGEYQRIGSVVNSMVDQLSSFSEEVTRVAREVGTEGKLGGQARVPGVSGTWQDLTESVNSMADNLTDQVRNIAQVTTAVAKGDLTQKISVDVRGEMRELKETINTMVDQLDTFADEVTRVAREVGTEGKLGGQAHVRGVSGTWKDLTENVNQLAGNLTGQVRNIAQVTTAVAKGDLTRKITVEAQGEVLELKETINTMVDQLSAFADEVTKVARDVGTEGKLGGQAEVPGVSGTWKDLTENVNQLAGNLTGQVRNIAQVTTGVARGDLSTKITVDARGEMLELKETINTMVDQLGAFADEVTRVAREVGTEGKLGGQAHVRGVSGTWKDLTENVNQLASNLTTQVRDIAQVTTAVAKGDLTRKITVEVRGELLELKETINTMVDQLDTFADEVTRVAREVGTEGKLGGQAHVRGVSGTWKDLTESVNSMADNLTDQVRNIAQVTTAVARGDLSQKMTVGARGEILQLKTTINTMVDQLSSFAAEVTRVAREVGTEGKLGGQAEVEGVSGTWKRLTSNVNQLASNLTTQVRAIAEVATSVTTGDMTGTITVEAPGEMGQLKDNINKMIANLRVTTRRNEEQDWLNSNLARIGAMLQGHRDLGAVAHLLMRELTPLVGAQYGAFFMIDVGHTPEPVYSMLASYGFQARSGHPTRFEVGEGLVGQAAQERLPILVTDAPPGYVRISSGLGESGPVNLMVLPVLFEDQALAVIELASFREFSEVNRSLLEQIVETVGVVLNTIIATMRTEELLKQSQTLAEELQTRSRELQRQQAELQHTNAELEEKALQLAKQNQAIEVKNAEIELARRDLEDRAEQLALSSRYKTEFLANMSHELRTPLNSLLILAKLLAENPEGNLTKRQVEFARSLHDAGDDLLNLISDILDVAKVESGKMDVNVVPVRLRALCADLEQMFRPIADRQSLFFSVGMAEGTPGVILTDERRLQQVLKNLLSNAFKFTEEGSVLLRVELRQQRPPALVREESEEGTGGDIDPNSVPARVRVTGSTMIAFSVTDTGIGIEGDKLNVIFEAFQQADGTTSRKYGGTGLGLSISRQIARLLGGELHVDSEPGIGSTFTLLLPTAIEAPPEDEHEENGHPSAKAPVPARAEGTATEQQAEETASSADSTATAEPSEAVLTPPAVTPEPGTGEAPAGSPPGEEQPADQENGQQEVVQRQEIVKPSPSAPPARESLRGRRILIVDDDVRNVYALTSALEDRGMDVLCAEDGTAGIEMLQSTPDVELVLMDIMMPGMDGYQTTRAIRELEQFREIPIIALTAKAMRGDRDKALEAGASDYITKPVDMGRLLGMMETWLQE